MNNPQNTGATRTVIRGAAVFDGVAEELAHGIDVLIEDGLITEVGSQLQGAADAAVIDAAGRTLMPGLSDAHWHVQYAGLHQLDQLRTEQPDYITAKALEETARTLLRGFTTVRDLGGSVFGIKKAIDEGAALGPRILPSGTHLGITGGHADYTESWRPPRNFTGEVDHFERIEAFRMLSGRDQMLDAVRFNFKRGASQIKLLMGGGVASNYDPLDVEQFTFDEVRAAVEVAENWGSYVTVHVYNPRGIKKALDAGVVGIEHGHLLDDETAALMRDKGAWLCIQPFSADMPGAREALGEERFAKFLQVANGFQHAMDLARERGIPVAFGTDLSFTPASNGLQANYLAQFGRWMDNAEILRMATSGNAGYFELAGERHPYRRGRLGVIAPGAYADLLLVDGDPLADLSLLGDNGEHLSLIMKDGRIYKDRL